MRKLLLPVLLLISTISFGQTDTSKLLITITLKQKHIGYMAQKLSESNTLADSHLRDSLIKYMGSGLLPDSQVTTHFSAGIVFKLVNDLFNETAGVSYSTIYELGNGGTGYTGLLAQLFIKGSSVNAEQGVAKWLFIQVNNVLTSGQTIMSSKIISGNSWLRNPISYN